MEAYMKKRIIVIGATGTIGRAIYERLSDDHEVLAVGYASGDLKVDLGSQKSIEDLFEKLGQFDHLISAAGDARFGTLQEISDEDFSRGLTNKLLGQMNLVRLGRDNVRDGGSITVTSGMLATDPWPGTSATSAANAGLNGFVKAAALESQRGVRINAVSPLFVRETALAMGMNGEGTISAAETANAYVAAIEGTMNGEVVDVADHVTSAGSRSSRQSSSA